MPTLDATVGGASTNTYATYAEASTYHNGHVYASTWTAATSTVKETALIMASRLLDEWVDWRGYRTTEGQALRWPRYNVNDRDGWLLDHDVIPTFLVNATSELARYLTTTDSTAIPDTQGFKELAVGSLKLVVDKEDRDKYGVLPDSVIVMIEPYGKIRKRGNTGAVKVSRA